MANQTEALFKFDTWSLKHKLVAGVDIANQTYNRKTLTLTPGPNTSLPILQLPARHLHDGRRRGFKASALGGRLCRRRREILSWLKFLAGARFDNFDSDITNFNANGTVATKFSRNDQFWSPRAALVVQPANWQTYYFAWGRSFNPSAETLNSINVANQGADPEKTDSYELGAKLGFFNNALGVTGAIFRINKANARTVDPITGIASLDGNVRSQGLELGIIGRPVPEWNIFFGYTHLNTEILEGFEVGTKGKDLANAPDQYAVAVDDVRLPHEVAGGHRHLLLEQPVRQQRQHEPGAGYVRWDLTGAYQVNKNVGVRLNIQNVMDTTYYDQVHPGHVIPGDGRTFILSGNFTF